MINLLAWLVMVRGIKNNNRDGVVRMLAGIGLKFLLYLLLYPGFLVGYKKSNKSIYHYIFCIIFIVHFFSGRTLA